MRIGVLGATGATGRHFIAAALREGHEVRALVRAGRPDGSARALPPRERLVQVVGDATDARVVCELAAGVEALVCLVGPGREAPADLCSKTAEALLTAAERASVARVVLVSGAMIGHPREHAHGLYRVVPHLLGAVRADRLRAEQLVASSGRRWTVVRPPRLSDGPTERWVTVGPDIEIGTMDAIPRIDLAEMLLETSTTSHWEGLAVAARTSHPAERPQALRVPLADTARSDTVRLPARGPRDHAAAKG